MMLNVGFFILILIAAELLFQSLVKYFRKEFQWLITEKDNCPNFDKIAFDKFIFTSFDKDLGWTKKPNTSGIERGKFRDITFNIDGKGSRRNPIDSETSIVTFGDSYTFCRQVEDHQTWQVYLSEKLGDKVLNFGVGNYGIDQAYLNYQRQVTPETTKVVILGFVPETICRIQSYWKHYLEFGNTFAFKPRFTLEHGQLQLHNNLLNGSEDFHKLDEIIQEAKKIDVFYEKKFKLLQFRFPYIFRYFLNFNRNTRLLYLLLKRKLFTLINKNDNAIDNAPFSSVMLENIKQSHQMYGDKNACNLLEAILLKFRDLAYERGHEPLVVVMPQLLDMNIMKKNKISTYQPLFSKINEKVRVLDMTQHLVGRNDLGSLYIDDAYGGHFSAAGNRLVAEKVSEFLSENSLISKE